MGNFNQIITKLNEDYRATVKAGSEDAYIKLSTIFGELDEYLREYQQDLTGDDVKKVIKKLKENDTITPADLDLIRSWMVGDADYYLKYENNFNDWNTELKRLVEEISSCKGIDSPDVASISRLRSLFRDASRVIADILYYVGQKDRLDKFNSATQEIDPEERAILARLLEQKMKSKDF